VRKKNIAQKIMILLVLFVLVFGSVFTEQVKAEPLDTNEVENSEAAATKPDLSATAESGSIELDDVEPELEISATIANDSDQEADQIANNNVSTESEVTTVVTVDSTKPVEEVVKQLEGITESAKEPAVPAEEATEPTEETTESSEKTTESIEETTTLEEVTEPEDEVAESTGETESTRQISDDTEDLPVLNSERKIAVRAATLPKQEEWFQIMDAQFLNKTGINMDDMHGWQCVDLADHYAASIFTNSNWRQTIRTGNANQLYAGSNGEYFEKIRYGQGNPQRGDIIFWHYGKNGHVAIVADFDGSGIWVYEQNVDSPYNGSTPVRKRFKTNLKAGYYGTQYNPYG